MADLNKLFAKKDANVESPIPATPAESGPLPSTAPSAGEAPAKPHNPFASAGGKGQGDSSERSGSGTPASSGNVSGGDKPKSGLSSISVSAATRDSDDGAGSVAGPTIDSLASLDSTEDEGIAPRGEGLSYFADETPATKPTRDLPEGITKESLGFVDMLDSVYNVIHDPELLGGVITNIMVELKSNPEYTKLIAPDDVRVMVRGMRESMGLARVKKQEAKAKRSGGGGRRGSKMVDADMLADLDSLGIPT